MPVYRQSESTHVAVDRTPALYKSPDHCGSYYGGVGTRLLSVGPDPAADTYEQYPPYVDTQGLFAQIDRTLTYTHGANTGRGTSGVAGRRRYSMPVYSSGRYGMYIDAPVLKIGFDEPAAGGGGGRAVIY